MEIINRNPSSDNVLIGCSNALANSPIAIALLMLKLGLILEDVFRYVRFKIEKDKFVKINIIIIKDMFIILT